MAGAKKKGGGKQNIVMIVVGVVLVIASVAGYHFAMFVPAQKKLDELQKEVDKVKKDSNAKVAAANSERDKQIEEMKSKINSETEKSLKAYKEEAQFSLEEAQREGRKAVEAKQKELDDYKKAADTTRIRLEDRVDELNTQLELERANVKRLEKVVADLQAKKK